MNKQNKDFYKTEDIVELLDVSIFTVRRHIKMGHLKAYKVDRVFRIKKDDFNLFLKNKKNSFR